MFPATTYADRRNRLRVQYRDFGSIRIEENVVMTSNGYRILGKKRPRTIEEVESLRSALS